GTADLFREGGTFHILVISGLHITFIGGFVLLVIRRFTQNRIAQFAVADLILWAYVLAVGADIPVVRAAIMFTVMLFSYVIYRQNNLLNSLGFCALILLVWRPADILNPSFQLTFVSVGAIVAIAFPLLETLRKIGSWMPTAEMPFPPNVSGGLKAFCEMLYWNEDAWKFESTRQIWTANIFKTPLSGSRVLQAIRKPLRFVFEGLLVSFVVQICMLPLSIVYFHRVSIGGIFLNIWIGLFMVFEAAAALTAIFFGQFSSILSGSFFAIAEFVNWLMLTLPGLIADNGILSFRLPAYSEHGRIFYFLYFIPILFLAGSISGWKPLEIKAMTWSTRRQAVYPALASMAVLLGIIVFHPLSAPSVDGRLGIDFLDVGQGDAALVTFPDGRTLLVDGGGRMRYRDDSDDVEPFERDVRGIGESVVSEFLWHQGYSRIDYVMGTHADADHIQGLVDVAKNFNIGTAIFGEIADDDPDFIEVAEVLRKSKVPIDVVSRGDILSLGGATLEVLSPAESDGPRAGSDNDRSIVFRISYGGRSFLLTGDIERRTEADLIGAGRILRADVVKVPHHGSRTSSTQPFVDAVGARFAIIPVGRSSPFGHPHAEVVERWRSVGAVVMSTGERGTISVSTDGNDLQFRTFNP
ncbi:MAG: ComEC/Rec2 family competence protein, partial [Pyrinomonadaceae bacterium]